LKKLGDPDDIVFKLLQIFPASQKRYEIRRQFKKDQRLRAHTHLIEQHAPSLGLIQFQIMDFMLNQFKPGHSYDPASILSSVNGFLRCERLPDMDEKEIIRMFNNLFKTIRKSKHNKGFAHDYHVERLLTYQDIFADNGVACDSSDAKQLEEIDDSLFEQLLHCILDERGESPERLLS